MNFHESADRDFSIQFCEYNYSNPDYDQIYRPNGSGDYLFLLFKTPMKIYLDKNSVFPGKMRVFSMPPGMSSIIRLFTDSGTATFIFPVRQI